jgi:uncharacterized RDD family membrane protein YckC
MGSLPLAPAVLSQISYASVGRRITAHLIDITIAFTVTLAAGFFMRHFLPSGLWTVPEADRDLATLVHALPVSTKLAVIMAFVVSKGTIYSGLFQASAWQASIGKRLLGIYVTDRAGKRLGLLRSLGRSFTKDFFDVLPFLGATSVATIVATSKKQALHDYAAGTVVMKGRSPGTGSPGLWRIVVGFGIQSVWYIVTMLAVFKTLS